MTTTTAHCAPPARSGRACRCAACSASSPRPTPATARGRSSAARRPPAARHRHHPRRPRCGGPAHLLLVSRSAERVARQLLVDRRPRRRDASGRGGSPRPRTAAPRRRRVPRPPAPAAPASGEALRQPRERDVRHEAAAGQRDAGAARRGLDLGLQVARARGSRRRRHRRRAAGRRRRGRGRRAPARSPARRPRGRRCRRPRAGARGSRRGRPASGAGSRAAPSAAPAGPAAAASARSAPARAARGRRRRGSPASRPAPASTSFSTGGPIPSTMAATPSALGWRPSGWKSAMTWRMLRPSAMPPKKELT